MCNGHLTNQADPTAERGACTDRFRPKFLLAMSRAQLLLLGTLVLALASAEEAVTSVGEAASAIRRRPNGRAGRRNRGKNRCRLPGCLRCHASDREVCDMCRNGYAKLESGKCQACGFGCQDCSKSGPGACDKCKSGFTYNRVSNTCERCAAHCLKCDEAGPGGCNECGARRMLHARLELDGEVHECLECDKGCRECSEAHGCTACDAFHTLQPDGNGASSCSFAWMRAIMLLAIIVVPVSACCYALSVDDEVPRHRPPRTKEDDSASVVRSEGDALRRRGGGDGKPFGGRPNDSPTASPRPPRPDGAYPLLPGYSGIEITE